MSIVGGLSAQFGMIDEVTFGSVLAPTRFMEFTTESAKNAIERIESAGLRPARRVLTSDDWLPGRVGVTGDLEFELGNKGFGLMLKHMMGTIASSQPSAGPNPTVWEHKATVGQIDGKSFTAQLGRTGNDGTTRAFTYGGCKADTWELACDSQGIVMLKVGVDAANEATAAPALATASYAANIVPLVYTGGAITIGGTATDVQKATLTGNNNLKKDRYFIRATTPAQKKEQLEGNGLREYGGTLDVEFSDLVPYNRFINGTVGALTLFYTGAIISTTFAFALEVTCAAVRFDGETPNVGGPDIIEHSLPFKVLDSGAADGPVSMVYRTTDTTP